MNLSLVCGTYPGEDPSTLALKINGKVCKTQADVSTYRADGSPQNVELCAIFDGPYQSVEIVKVEPAANAGPIWDEGTIGAAALLKMKLHFEGDYGAKSFPLVQKINWHKAGAVRWEVHGEADCGQYGSVAWIAQAWTQEPFVDFFMLHHNADCAKPLPKLRINHASIQSTAWWGLDERIDYPRVGDSLPDARTTLLQGRFFTRRYELVDTSEPHEVVRRVLPVDHPRSFWSDEPCGARYSPHGDPLPKLTHRDIQALVAKVKARHAAYVQAFAADGTLPGDAQHPASGRHGTIWTTGSPYGGVGGGEGLYHRPCVELARAAAEDPNTVYELLCMQAWAEEGRGLGVLFWGGQSCALPGGGFDPGHKWPAAIQQAIDKDGGIGGANYELLASPGIGWINSDPFGFKATPAPIGTPGHREAELEQYGTQDEQHLLRAFGHHAALASLFNDPLAKFVIRGLADAVRWSEHEGPGGGLRKMLDAIMSKENNGGAPMGREFAEMLRCVTEAWWRTDPKESVRWGGWIECAINSEFFARMPSGETRDHTMSNHSKDCTPEPRKSKWNEQRGVSQSWYTALWADAIIAASESTEPPSSADHVPSMLHWWWLEHVDGRKTWARTAAVADWPDSQPWQSLSDVPLDGIAHEKDGAGNPLPAIATDSFYHPGALGSALCVLLDPQANADPQAVYLACYMLHEHAQSMGKTVAQWIRERSDKNDSQLDMDAPLLRWIEHMEDHHPGVDKFAEYAAKLKP